LKAGCGFGGSCFPKDLRALVQWGRDHEQGAPLLDAVVQVNTSRSAQVLRLLGKHFSDLRGVRVAVLGLSFKPGTDDIRESPALRLMPELLARGADIRAYDPVATSSMRAVFGAQEVDYRSTLHEALGDADAVVLLTAWPEFQQVPDLLDRLAISPVVIDGRRVLDPRRFARFEGIGRSAAAGSPARSDDLGNEVVTGATNSA
jgi:UDPglucose 6-dehydrogenase/GDP-mannose 6-dehydrogenase